MDWVYLAVSVNGAAYTLNALKPRKQGRALLGWSWFASWLTIELAWVNLVWQVAATAYFARRGALRSGKGKLALLINLASWAGLVSLVMQSMKVRHEIHAAFRDAPSAAGEPRRLGVARTRNITFAKVAGQILKLDVFAPKTPATPGVKRPAIIQIHGGAWVLGDKREQGIPLLKLLASQGWVGFNINYRLSPAATFPDHLVDCKRALAWVREHADEYGIDPDFIVVTGGSAGGHLAALMALTANRPDYQPGFEHVDTTVQAAVTFYGMYDFANRNGFYGPDTERFFEKYIIKAFKDTEPEKFAAASPLDQIHADAPPFLVIHGALDTIVPVGIGRDFVAALRETSKAPVIYLELAGAQHAFESFPSIRANQVVQAVERFIDTLWTEYQRGLAPQEVPAEELAEAVDADTSGSVSA